MFRGRSGLVNENISEFSVNKMELFKTRERRGETWVTGNFPESYPDATTEILSNRKDEIGVINEEAYAQLTAGNARGESNNKDAYLFLNLKLEIFLSKDMFKPKPKPSKRQ